MNARDLSHFLGRCAMGGAIGFSCRAVAGDEGARGPALALVGLMFLFLYAEAWLDFGGRGRP